MRSIPSPLPDDSSLPAASGLRVIPQGDGARLAQLHYSSLLRLAMRLTGNEVEARDLVQDAFEKALRRQASFTTGTNERAWLHTILYNAFIDGRRQARGRAFVSDAALADRSDDEQDSAPPPPWADISREQLLTAIDELDADFRHVYRLHALEQRSYREIAETLSILPQTVATRLVRARSKLKVRLLAMLQAGTEGT